MFVFPMLGKSSRFYDAGYSIPKYKLTLGTDGKCVLDHVLESFRDSFKTDLFIFICRTDSNDKFFINEKLINLGISRFKIIEFEGDTRGQAESVEIAIVDESEDEELFIFNIDTILYNFKKDLNRKNIGGYIEVFYGDGNHWSFVEPSKTDIYRAIRVVEKERISNLCSNGLYYFSKIKYFNEALKNFKLKNNHSSIELYIAPLYNELIELGMIIKYKIVDIKEIGFCGVPLEYENLNKSYLNKN
jgi:dTDP-glucose pyrophosphorylase